MSLAIVWYLTDKLPEERNSIPNDETAKTHKFSSIDELVGFIDKMKEGTNIRDGWQPIDDHDWLVRLVKDINEETESTDTWYALERWEC